MYNIKSNAAGEFIDHSEITATMEYARANSRNRALIENLIDKAALGRGLSHREAAVLVECREPDLEQRMFALAKEIKERLYGNRIVMFAPLYLSNHCVNSCLYCPYHASNDAMPRRRLAQEEIAREVAALQDMGHKRLALEAGEHPLHAPMDYILESIRTIYGVRHRNGAIRRVNVNIAAATVGDYRRLREAGIGTYILFQETYDKAGYERLHPRGPKSDYAYHTEAMDRAMEGGIDDVGLGVLFGLGDPLYDLVGLLMHAEHLEAAFGVGPHTISVPRICPADDVDMGALGQVVPDDLFHKLVAAIRLSVPYTGMIISTRESPASRRRALELGVSQLSGGSRTGVGGYAGSEPQPEADYVAGRSLSFAADGGAEQSLSGAAEGTEQFDISDRRTLDEIVGWLLDMGHIPSFCTACYWLGRTGDRFMSLVKSGQIVNVCAPNSLMTLAEYLRDYASPEVRRKGLDVIRREVGRIPSAAVREKAIRNLDIVATQNVEFRF